MSVLRFDSKLYGRIKTALSKQIFQNFTIHLTWIPPEDTKICPSSIAKYFTVKEFVVKFCKTKLKCHQHKSLKIPKFRICEENDELCTPNELVEYTGMLALSCPMKNEEFINSYCCPGPYEESNNIRVLNLKGLFTCEFIERLFNEMR